MYSQNIKKERKKDRKISTPVHQGCTNADHSRTHSKVKSPVHWAQWTGDSHLGLVVPGFRLLIRITAVREQPCWRRTIRRVLNSPSPLPHTPALLPLSFSVLARFASGRCACSLPECIPSKLYVATQALRCPQGATLRKSTRTRRLGGLRTDGRTTSQRFASGLCALLSMPTPPLRIPPPFLHAPPSREQVELQSKVFAARKQRKPRWQLCGKPLIVSAHHRKLLMEGSVRRGNGSKRKFTCVR